MNNIQYTYFPTWVSNKGIIWGLLAMISVILLFDTRLMPLYLYVFFLIEVIGFFHLSQTLSHMWSGYSSKEFIKWAFIVGIFFRIPLTAYCHIHYTNEFGQLYFHNILGDTEVYVGLPYLAVENIINKGDWNFLNDSFLKYLAFDDIGAPILNTFLLLITGNISPCGVPLIVNVFLGAYTTIFVYHIAKRHFGEDIARMTAIFCMLNPNLIWWCSSLLKEIQMTFFTFWFLDRMDGVLYKGKVSLVEVMPIALIGMFVFLYRAALGVLLFVSFYVALLLIDRKLVSINKKIIAGIMTAVVLLLGFGEQMVEQTQSLQSSVENGGQETNMEWRSDRENGNKFAVYAGAAVFAPLIFTIPFPTISYTYEEQESLMEVAGGNFIKNILSFFVILSMFMLLFSGEWRLHIFLIACLVGYLFILVMSTYAQSGRFHVPALPLEMMFVAYGIKQVILSKPIKGNVGRRNVYKRWFGMWCFLMFIACIVWQWFKLEGQGLL